MNAQSSLAVACSLTPADYAERLREFRLLFASALRESRREPTRLYLAFDPHAAFEDDVRDLLKGEQECCPFFSFSVDAQPAAINVEAAVPDGAEECLNYLERMATRGLAAKV